MANRKITWSKSALKQFEAAINYIAEDSIQNAEKVRKEILEKIEKVTLYPEIHSPDKYKLTMMAVTELLNCIVIELPIELKKKKFISFV